MPPILFLGLMLMITALAVAADRIIAARRHAQLGRLAADWKMSYVPQDVFNLARRIATSFPVPDAADLRVVDLIYGAQGNRHHYVFTAEYTQCVAGAHRRQWRAFAVCEPQDATGPCKELRAAPDDLPLVEQYSHLHRKESPA